MKGYKKINLSGDDLVPGFEVNADFKFANPSILVDGEFYYRLRYMRRYEHIRNMGDKLKAYIRDIKQEKGEGNNA